MSVLWNLSTYRFVVDGIVHPDMVNYLSQEDILTSWIEVNADSIFSAVNSFILAIFVFICMYANALWVVLYEACSHIAAAISRF